MHVCMSSCTSNRFSCAPSCVFWSSWSRSAPILLIRTRKAGADAAFLQVLPFLFVRHPHASRFHVLGFVETGLVFTLAIVLSLAPSPFKPHLKNVPPNPAQTASPLSRIFFGWLEGGMHRYYARTSNTLSRVFRLDNAYSFKPFVPPLPDYLYSDYVLSYFRWEGDRGSSEARDKAARRSRVTGGTKAFVWKHKGDLAGIVAFATAWILFIFVSPLSMNLVSLSPVYI